MSGINSKTGAVVSILFIVVIWGSASSVTKFAVEDIPPYIFAFLRNVTASVALLIFYLIRRKKGLQQQEKPPMGKIVWMGLTGVGFFYVFFNLALYFTTAAAGALIQGFIPAAIILLAIIFLKEKLNMLQLGGILLSIAGVVMIGFVGLVPDGRDTLLGNVLMIFAVLCWGVYTIISKSMQRYEPIHLTTMTTLIGTAFLVPAVIIEYWLEPAIPCISWGGWAAILYLGLLSSALCYILYNGIMKVLPAVQVGNFMNLDPIVGAVVAVAFLHERVTGWQVAGAVLVLAGVVLTSARQNQER